MAKTDIQPVENQQIAATDTGALMVLALERAVPIETLERIMAMRDREIAQQARRAFYAALASFQGECPVIAKDDKAGDSTFGYKYASLDTIKNKISPLMVKNGLSYRVENSFAHAEDGNASVTATVIVSHSAGHSEASSVTIPIDRASRMNASQKVGSACTYAGRYALVAALGLVCGGEDNDAQSLNAEPQQAKTEPVKPKAQAKPQRDPDAKLAGKDLADFRAAVVKKGFTMQQVLDLAGLPPREMHIASEEDLTNKEAGELLLELMEQAKLATTEVK